MKTLVNCPCARWHKEAGWVGNPDCFLGCGGTGTLTFVEPDPDPCTCPGSMRYATPRVHSGICPEFKLPAETRDGASYGVGDSPPLLVAAASPGEAP